MLSIRRLVLISMLMLAGCSETYERRDFSPPDGQFVVSVPATLETNSKTVETLQGSGTVTTHSVNFDGVLYGVTVITLPEESSETPYDPRVKALRLAAARDNMLASNGWRLLKEVGDRLVSTDPVSKYGTKLTAAAGPNHTATVRIFLRDGHAFQITTVVPSKPSYNQEVYSVRFLESFKLRS